MAESVLEYRASMERLSDVQRRLAVEIPWAQVKGRLDEAYGELGRGVELKGFRRGKVPRQLLERLFGPQVSGDVAQGLVRDSIAKALGEHEIDPVAPPAVEEGAISEGQDFRYSALLEVLPEVELKDYFDVEIERRPAQVSDEQVERALRAKQQELTEYVPVEGRTTASGDVLLVDLLGRLGDRPYTRDGVLVELGDVPREPLPGLAAALTGIAPETKELNVELELSVAPELRAAPELSAAPELIAAPGSELGAALRAGGDAAAPGKARLLVTVNDVKRKVVPELDDEMARDTGEAETLVELREKLRQQLIVADERRALDECKELLVKKLLERHEVPLAPALVERQIEQLAAFQRMLLGEANTEDEAARERLRSGAEQSVRSFLLIEAIAKREGVTVVDEDIERHLQRFADERGQHISRVRSEYEKEDRMEQLRRTLRHEKTMDLLLARSKVSVAAHVAPPAGDGEPG